MKSFNTLLLLFLTGTVLLVASCKKDDKKDVVPDDKSPKPSIQTYYGAAATLSKGTARTFVIIQDGAPTTIGIRISETALSGLPADSTKEWEYKLPMPTAPVAKLEGFDHIAVDWNPVGHDPKPIYGLPHFDFHFYRIPESAQERIVGGPDKEPVGAYFTPQDYSPGPVAISVPMMGVHWNDMKAPEFTGKKFTDTFIYGFYQGSLVFQEPMATLAYIQSKPDFKINIKQPKGYQRSGYYPMVSHLYYDAGSKEYVMALETLTYLEGGY